MFFFENSRLAAAAGEKPHMRLIFFIPQCSL
jgi:hypothetical protein